MHSNLWSTGTINSCWAETGKTPAQTGTQFLSQFHLAAPDSCTPNSTSRNFFCLFILYGPIKVGRKGKFALPRDYTFAAWFLLVKAWVPEGLYRAEVITGFLGQAYGFFDYSKFLALVSIRKTSISFESEDFYLLASWPFQSPSSLNLIVASFRIWKNRL